MLSGAIIWVSKPIISIYISFQAILTIQTDTISGICSVLRIFILRITITDNDAVIDYSLDESAIDHE